ncbi:metal-sensitive transcriptional regulator, partial [Microbacterium sp. BF1]|uniref:metal-sensitive transcriptional regulator n=1 Tax=Microbacterium sp. BF1 TaxID=2821146 RepID=UPI002119CFB6
MNGCTDNKADLRKRLSRVEGQVRGIARMVDEDKYCIDILTQDKRPHSDERQTDEEALAGRPLCRGLVRLLVGPTSFTDPRELR